MSIGALMGGPTCGWSSDKYGPWIPISVTASCCAFGCLWRGLAGSITSLRMGAILLGIGVNLWTVVLGHTVKSFSSKLRSEVLAGFSVQMTILQLCGKGIYPIIEYVLHSILQIHDELLRYRIHMGLCTFFCFYGVVALLMDRKNVMSNNNHVKSSSNGVELTCDQSEQKQIEYNVIMEKRLDSKNSSDDWQEDHVDNRDISTQQSQIELIDSDAKTKSGARGTMIGSDARNESSSAPSLSSSFVNEPEDSSMIIRSSTATTTASNIQHASSAASESQQSKRRGKKDILTTAILTLALLIQSISTTFLTVLWPLLSKDIFALSAHTFGIITFISSIVSTGAVASFPIVERMEKVGGRVRCAALGFAVSTVLCFLFCYCTFIGVGKVDMMELGVGSYDTVLVKGDGISNRSLEEGGDVLTINDADLTGEMQQQLRSRSKLIWQSLSAILFQASLFFLEPSLKSILSLSSLSTPASRSTKGSSSLGFTMGYLTMLGHIGGMVGNLAGTWMYTVSTEAAEGSFGQGGSLPFLITGILLGLTSVIIWRLEEPRSLAVVDDNGRDENDTASCNYNEKEAAGMDLELGALAVQDGDSMRLSEPVDGPEEESGCCLTLRETTYDLKLD